MKKAKTMLPLAGWSLCLALALSASVAAEPVQVRYQLPTDGPLPQTYRVTLAITTPDDPDWIVSTFVAGGVRTVTAENQGKFTETWDGLDDNGMPVPPGTYRVKGIYAPAQPWKIDGEYHALIPRYLFGAGDSWTPTPENDDKFPWIFGHVFGYITDVQVGPNGQAGFLANYIENSFNPFLVDLAKPIGYDQVLQKYDSGGTAGGPTVACDGEHIWFAGGVGDPFLHRADRQWGQERNVYGVPGRKLATQTPSLVAWRDPATGKRFLYVAQPGEVNQVLVFDGDTGQTLAETPLRNPQALSLDRAAPGPRLVALHSGEDGAWLVSSVALREGLSDGAWSPLFTIRDIAHPTDCEMDSRGNFYVSDTQANQVYQLDGQGKIVHRFGRTSDVGNGRRAVPTRTPYRSRPGQYDEQVFMSPTKLAVWTDPDGQDRLLVLESAGPGRISEWAADGRLIRQWFLCQNSAEGYCLDPEQPEHVYTTGFGGGLIRFLVDYDRPPSPASGGGAEGGGQMWKVDAVWPDLCRGGAFPGGRQFPRLVNLNGRKYLAFAGAAHGGFGYMIYRMAEGDWLPSAGIIAVDSGQKDGGGHVLYDRFWWHDANGDGEAQAEEYQGRPANLPCLTYWGDQWLEDLSLVVCDQNQGRDVWRLAPSGFDPHGNPIFDEGDGRGWKGMEGDGKGQKTKWQKLLTDTVYAALAEGKTDALHGGNEVFWYQGPRFGGWERIDGSMEEGFYLADPSGPPNPGGIDNAGSRYAQFKLSRYVPVVRLQPHEFKATTNPALGFLRGRPEFVGNMEEDGPGGFTMKWRVGRKAWRLANPGEVYGTQHLTAPVYGLVGVFDSNGLYHVYTDEGLYVDTLMVDCFRHGLARGGMYSHSGEIWYGKHTLNRKNGKVYLFMGRSAATVYEVEGWTPNLVRRLNLTSPVVSITAGQMAPANEYALAVRGGAGAAKVAKFYPAPGGGPAIDGSMAGWEAGTPVTFQLDENRKVEVRCMYDPEHLYLRWHVRRPIPPPAPPQAGGSGGVGNGHRAVPLELGDPARIFTHGRAADTVSFYLQGDPNAPPSAEEGRPGDLRLVFAIVQDGPPPLEKGEAEEGHAPPLEKGGLGGVRPIALGMYPRWFGEGQPTPVTYTSPVGQVHFEHVGLLESVRLAHAFDEDGQGFVIAAAVPRTALPPSLPRFSGDLRTRVDFAATLGGVTNFWWANTGQVNNTVTVDEPAEARLYPGAWAQAQFVGLEQELPLRSWLVCGPWGGEKLKERPNDPHPQPLGHAFTKRFFAEAKYPPDGGNVDRSVVYTGPLTQDVSGNPHEVRWQVRSTPGDRLELFSGLAMLGYVSTWIHVPQDGPIECTFLCPRDAQGNAQVWINGEKVQEQRTDAWGVEAWEPVEKQTVAFRRGWNQVFYRGYLLWGGLNLGLVLHGPEELLWSIQVSPTPPEGREGK